jgi:hypothetical protein
VDHLNYCGENQVTLAILSSSLSSNLDYASGSANSAFVRIMEVRYTIEPMSRISLTYIALALLGAQSPGTRQVRPAPPNGLSNVQGSQGAVR